MKRLFLVSLVLIVSSPVALCDPVADFVSKLINSSDANANWNGESEEKLNGGYLFRFDCDIDRDGVSELFVSSSLDAERNVCLWTVFRKGPEETYAVIGTKVILDPAEGFYLTSFNNVPQIKTAFVKPPDFGIIFTYTLGADNKIGEVSRKLSAAEANTLINDDNAEQIFELGQIKKPAVQKILLAEYLKVPKAPWRPYQANLGVLAQEEDPADAAALKHTKEFTVEDAKALLASRRPQ